MRTAVSMTKYQARILLILLRAAEAAEQDGWRLPASGKLAQLLYENGVNRFDNVVKKISGRTASNHIKRLQDVAGCFQKRGHSWYLCPEKLVTEPETARFLLTVDRMVAREPEVRIPEERLYRLQSKFYLRPQTLETLLRFAYKEEYLEVFPTNPEFIRVGRRTKQQKHYLELLAHPFNLDSLIEEIDRDIRRLPNLWWV